MFLDLRSGLKKDVEGIANRESYSVTQICEAFLLAGSDAYKQGGKFVTRALTRLITIQLIGFLPKSMTIYAQDRVPGAHVRSPDECGRYQCQSG